MTAALLLAAALPASAASPAAVAGSVVRSKEWVIRRGAAREEEFIGDVRYDSGGTRLSADWALFKHADKTWRAKGSVVLRRRLDDGTELWARGERAGHDEASRRGFLEPAPGGRVPFTRTPPEGGPPDRGESGRVSWDSEQNLTLSGGARLWGPRLECAADRAYYERAAKRLTLSGGRPMVHKVAGEWTTAFRAEETVALESPRRLEARGKVKGWMIFHEPPKGKPK